MDTLATGGGDSTVRLWNLDVNSAISRICTVAGKDLTPMRWQTVRSRPMNAIRANWASTLRLLRRRIAAIGQAGQAR
jgi:hypothetical protein